MPDWKAIETSILAQSSDSVLPSSIELPILPRALTEFRNKAQDPDASANELSRIIASDVGLSAELLRNANSCRTGARATVTSVKQALIVLGIPSTLLHLTTSSMKQVMKSSSSKLINFQIFWNTNLERSLFAKEVASLLKADTDLAFTAGMLQDFLLPLITNQMFDDYLEFMENRDAYANIIAFEQQQFGWDHASSAAQVMHDWHFPPELVCCVWFHHSGVEILKNEQFRSSPAAAVAVSSLLPDALRQEADGLATLIELERTWPEFELLPIAERIDEEFRELSNDGKNHFSLLRSYQNAIKKMSDG